MSGQRDDRPPINRGHARRFVIAALALMLLLAVRAAGAEPASTPPLILAAYQAWFGLPSHLQPPPYDSTDPAVIAQQIEAAQSRGIRGFVVDWYGPAAETPNGADRAHIDAATAELLRQAESRAFYGALMYDEGTLRASEALTTAYTNRAIDDLQAARAYFDSQAYLRIDGQPALFVFPYPDVDPYVDWAQVRAQLGEPVVLLDEDPNPDDAAHDALFDGFYAWVQPTASLWPSDCSEWGQGYLTWFYATMGGGVYADKVAVGGVWPGFDDEVASWGLGRRLARRCGRTWEDTWALAEAYAPPIVLIATWNDVEEGTDIEWGTTRAWGASLKETPGLSCCSLVPLVQR